MGPYFYFKKFNGGIYMYYDKTAEINVEINEKMYNLKKLKRVHDILENGFGSYKVIIGEDLVSDEPEDWYSEVFLTDNFKSFEIENMKVDLYYTYSMGRKNENIVWGVTTFKDDPLTYIGSVEPIK
jgi:hypothetical protein